MSEDARCATAAKVTCPRNNPPDEPVQERIRLRRAAWARRRSRRQVFRPRLNVHGVSSLEEVWLERVAEERLGPCERERANGRRRSFQVAGSTGGSRRCGMAFGIGGCGSGCGGVGTGCGDGVGVGYGVGNGKGGGGSGCGSGRVGSCCECSFMVCPQSQTRSTSGYLMDVDINHSDARSGIYAA
jgi:hypothetical protein